MSVNIPVCFGRDNNMDSIDSNYQSVFYNQVYFNQTISKTSEKIWLADNHQSLQIIEKTIVNQMTLRPYSLKAYYHLGLYYVKQAMLTDQDSNLSSNYLYKASMIARQMMTLHPQSYLGFLIFGYIAIVIDEVQDAQSILDYLIEINGSVPVEAYPLNSLLLVQKPKNSNNNQQLFGFLDLVIDNNSLGNNMKVSLLRPIVIKFSDSAFLRFVDKGFKFNRDFSVEMNYLIGYGYFYRKNIDKALFYYKRAYEHGYSSTVFYYNYAKAALHYQPEFSLSLFNLVLAQNRKNHTGHLYSYLHSNIGKEYRCILWDKGMAYLLINDQEKALANHTLSIYNALKENKSFALSMIMRLKLVYAQHNYHRYWLTILQNLTKLAPGNYQIHQLIGQYFLDHQDIKLAKASFKDALVLKDPFKIE